MEMNFVKLLTFGALFAFVIACGDDSSSSSFANGGGSGAGKNGAENGSGNGVEYDAAAGTLKDLRDGQMYKTVKIGNQVWMAENLNYETATSVLIPEYNGKPREKYGRLYTWDDAMKACPSGWRLPSEDDWNELLEFVGDSATAGTKLKAARDWDKARGDVIGTDDYGFAALPAGVSHVNGNGVRSFSNNGAFFWTATENGRAILIVMHYEKEVVESSRFDKETWLSVRCIMD